MTKNTNFFVALIVVFSETSSVVERTGLKNDPLCPCEEILKPVCGSDGDSYTNACILQCSHHYYIVESEHDVQLTSPNLCQRPKCNCNLPISQVCGTDNYTYLNECYLNCNNHRNEELSIRTFIEIARKEQCYAQNVCINNIHPVCGTDSKTYRNLCFLQHNSNQNVRNDLPPIYLKSWGQCNVEMCDCPLEKDPVCSSNGKEYSNLCIFQCENRRRIHLNHSFLELVNKGSCNQECLCPELRNPVCGSDGKTYASQCLLDCTNKRRNNQGLPPIKQINQGSCDCFCTDKYEPICGSDGKTYRNKCALMCENKLRQLQTLTLFTLFHEGKCNDCTCSKHVDPVCSSDGRNFNNPCFLICENQRREFQGLVALSYMPGPCVQKQDYIYDPTCVNDLDSLSNPCQLLYEPNKSVSVYVSDGA